MPTSAANAAIRSQLVDLLSGGGAHADFEEVIAGLPPKLHGAKSGNIPHTPWRLIEHMRLAQEDILEFCVNPQYQERAFPDDYWPASDGPESNAAWDQSVERFREDLKKMQDLISDSKTDLFAKIPWGDGQTYLREALLVADHNAYHLGELVTLRRALGVWQ